MEFGDICLMQIYSADGSIITDSSKEYTDSLQGQLYIKTVVSALAKMLLFMEVSDYTLWHWLKHLVYQTAYQYEQSICYNTSM